MVVERFTVPLDRRVTLRITTRSASVSVIASDAGDVEVEAEPDTDIHVAEANSPRAAEVRITSPSGAVSVRCPRGVDVVLGLTSGQARLAGRYGDVRVLSRSGRVEVDEAASLDVRTSSGNIVIGQCHGECRLMSRSGSVAVGSAGRLNVATKSGKVYAETVEEATVHAASGSVSLGATGTGDLAVRVMSGSVFIAVAGGRRPRLRTRVLSGSVRNECEEGDDFRIEVTTLSGSVSVTPQ